MRILLADADQTLCTKLEAEGFIVEGTTDGLETEVYLQTLPFDATLIVCPLSEMVPARFIHDLRRDKIATPIIIQGQFDAVERIKLLTVGADDVIPHDMLSDEVVARLRALIRRSAGAPSSVLTVGPVTLNMTEKVASVGDRLLSLTGREYGVLEQMMLRKGTTVTKEMFLSQLYAPQDEPQDTKILDVFVCKVRKKLAAFGVSDFVRTVWGRGYMVGEPVATGAVGMANNASWQQGNAEGSVHRIVSPSMVPAMGVA